MYENSDDFFDCLKNEGFFKSLSLEERKMLLGKFISSAVMVLEVKNETYDPLIILDVVARRYEDMMICIVLTPKGSIQIRVVSAHRIVL